MYCTKPQEKNKQLDVQYSGFTDIADLGIFSNTLKSIQDFRWPLKIYHLEFTLLLKVQKIWQTLTYLGTWGRCELQNKCLCCEELEPSDFCLFCKWWSKEDHTAISSLRTWGCFPHSSLSQQLASSCSRFCLASNSFCFLTILSSRNLTFFRLMFLSAFFKEYLCRSSSCTSLFLFCCSRERQVSSPVVLCTSASAHGVDSVCTANSLCCCWRAARRLFSFISHCWSVNKTMIESKNHRKNIICY